MRIAVCGARLAFLLAAIITACSGILKVIQRSRALWCAPVRRTCVLVSVANALSEKGDTRNWQTIPYSIHMAR